MRISNRKIGEKLTIFSWVIIWSKRPKNLFSRNMRIALETGSYTLYFRIENFLDFYLVSLVVSVRCVRGESHYLSASAVLFAALKKVNFLPKFLLV